MSEPRQIVDELSPREAYEALVAEDGAVMVDVRTRAEWAFVGVPDLGATGKPLLGVEWASYPAMAPNAAFVSELAQQTGDMPRRVFFICRSGARSMSAARAVAEAMYAEGKPVHCTNVAEGFEGDLDREGHRGRWNGWKAAGLPWRQS